MPIKNRSLTINFLVWNSTGNYAQTGDSTNLTMQLVKDGAALTNVTNAVSEVSATGAPGIYELALTSSEMNSNFVTLCGISATSDVTVYPSFLSTELSYLPIISGDIAGLNDPTAVEIASVIVTSGNAENWNATADGSTVTVSGYTQNALNVISGEATGALTEYDPPTRSELTTDTTSIITAITQTSGTLQTEHDTTQNYITTISGNIDDLSTDLGNIANVGAAVNTSATSYTLSSGTQSANTYASTAALDDVEHKHTDVAGDIDLYYEFDVGGDGVPTGTEVVGRLKGSNDDMVVYAYNWNTTSWDQIGNYAGQTLSTNVTRAYTLFTNHVGTGVNVGKVRIRFGTDGAGTLSSATLSIDQIFTSYSVVNRTIGYANGSIWVDTLNGVSGTELYVNGTADNPVNSWADALTISSNLNIKNFSINNGSTITLTANSDNYTMFGNEWNLNLNGQSINNMFATHSNIYGTGTGTNYRFMMSKIGLTSGISVSAGGMKDCAIGGLGITISTAGTYLMDGCFSAVAGVGTPYIEFGSNIGDQNLNMRHYAGGIEIKNIGASGTDNMSLEGHGQLVLNANCAGGTVALRGHFKVTDNSAGAVTLSDIANYDVSTIITSGTAANWDATSALTVAGIASEVVTSGNIENWNQYSDATLSNQNTLISNLATTSGNITSLNDISTTQVNTEVDSALSDYDSPTRTELTSDKNEIINNIGYASGKIEADISTLNNISITQVVDSGNVNNWDATSTITAEQIADTVVTSGNVAGWDDGATAAEVWANGTRSLTDKVNYGLSNTALAAIASTGTAEGWDSGSVTTEDIMALSGLMNVVSGNINNLNDLSTSDINTEVLDVISVDTYVEPVAGQPAANITIASAVNYIFRRLVRNKVTADASEEKTYKDDGSTVAYKRPISDAGGTTTKGTSIAP